MQPEELSAADREIAQVALLRIWLGRKKRAAWTIAHGYTQPVKRYDQHGRRLPARAGSGAGT